MFQENIKIGGIGKSIFGTNILRNLVLNILVFQYALLKTAGGTLSLDYSFPYVILFHKNSCSLKMAKIYILFEMVTEND